MLNPGIFIAFFAGIMSVASPCILPILPSFIGYITGISLQQTKELEAKKMHSQLVINTLLFGLGFSVTFLLFGAVIGFIGQSLLLNRTIFQQIGGVIIILFGLQLTGVIKIKNLLKERKFTFSAKWKKLLYLRSFLVGIIFAFSWAPCYGPIVGAILTLAVTQGSFYQSLWLFTFYSLGFLLPLIIIALSISHLSGILKKFRRIQKYSSIIAGIFVIMLGLLLLTNNLNLLVSWLSLTYTKNNISLL